ncbi:MAG: ATP-binding protein [Brevibacterium linens]
MQAEAKRKAAAERAERKATELLPAAGEPGPAALRTPGRIRLSKHQDTSATLAAQYPFLAEGGLGANGVFIGQDLYSGASFVYDPWVLYQAGIITAPNIVLAGIVGSGKSSLAKSLYTRSLPFGRRVYVPGDPKGEHTEIARAVGGRAIVLGHGLHTRLNPLDEGYRPAAMDDAEWAVTVASRRRDLIGALTETVLGRPMSPLEHTSIDTALTNTVRQNDVPILPMIVDHLLNPEDDADGSLREDGRLVGHALRRLVAGDLSGLFDGPSTERFDPTLPMVTLDLSRVTENSTLISVLMTCSSAWMESALLDPAGGQRWCVYDEAWRLMGEPALLKRMDAHWRLARAYGISNMLIFHKLTDLENVGDVGSAQRSLANSLLANAETRIVYRQESDQLGVTAKTLGLTGTEQSLLPTLGTGQGLWRIKERSFVVQHQLHPSELSMFDTTARMNE